MKFNFPSDTNAQLFISEVEMFVGVETKEIAGNVEIEEDTYGPADVQKIEEYAQTFGGIVVEKG